MLTSFIFPTAEYRRANGRIALIWALACALLLAAMWGAVTFKIQSDQILLIQQAERDACARAKAYAEQVLRSVAQIDQLSMSIKYQREHRPGMLDLEDQFRKGVYQNDIYPVLVDAKGYAVSSTRNLPRGTYMGDLEFFKRNRDQPRPQLHILAPTQGRGGFSDKQIIRFSRRIDKPDGSFNGAVLIAIEPEYLAGFHDASSMMPGDFVAVHFSEGALLASKGGKTATQTFYSSTPLFNGEEGKRDESAEFFSDKQSRLVGWQVLEGYPLVAVAALSKASVLEPYASTQRTYIGTISLFSLLLAGASFAGALNQIRNAARRRHAAQVQATFRLAVDGAREGFYMVSPTYFADGELNTLPIEDCNERAAELSGYTRSELVGKCCVELYEGQALASVKIFFQRVQAEKFVEDEFYVPEGRRHKSGWFQRRGVLSGQDIAVTVRDISDARQQAQALEIMATTDALTGLPNRHWLNNALPGMLERARESGQKLAVLAIDLDDFKKINDSLGHRTGDLLLSSVAKAMRQALPEQYHLARVGGDEFFGILENLTDGDGSTEARALLDAIMRSAAGTVWEKFPLGASLGISLYPADGEDLQSLMQAADIAMYEAKFQGKSQYRHYDEKYAQKIKDRILLERELQLAIRNDEFLIFYQPRADARTGNFSSMEALVRWQHPERGLISPAEFINVAEQTRLVIPLGELVVRKVCAQMADWQAQGVSMKCVSINVSALQLGDDSLRKVLLASLQQYGLHSSMVAIELTESRMLDEGGAAVTELRKLREMGIQLQIDDFGTGYSSLSQLQSLSIDVLKIDQSFVRKLGKDYQSEALCQTIVSIGRSLHIVIVAEGVETPQQLEKLQQMGCDEVQGYLLSKPVPAEAIPALTSRKFF
jgi:diguanylate cyclase (GGDEF)-like protein